MTSPEWPSPWHWVQRWWSPSMLEAWSERTEWWAKPAAWPTLAGPWGRSPQRVLLDLVEAVGGRFVGKQIDVEVQGQAVHLAVEGIQVVEAEQAFKGPWVPPWMLNLPGSRELSEWLTGLAQPSGSTDPPSAAEHMRVEAKDVRVGGSWFDHVTALVEDLRIEGGRQPHLITGTIKLLVRANRATLAAWLERARPGWLVKPRADGLVSVRPSGRRLWFIVRPSVSGREVHVEVLRVALFGVELTLPRRLVMRRTVPIPSPSPSLELIGVEEDGQTVMLSLRHAGIRQPIRLDRLRDVIKSGLSRLKLDAIAGT